MRLLLVEDDELLGDGIRTALQGLGYTVDWLKDGRAAQRALATERFNLVVLDLTLPGVDGLEVLRRARAAGLDVPVLVLTARDTVTDRVRGLDLGADDYLVKPFDVDELAARLRALERRGSGRATPVLVHGAVTLDPEARTVTLEGEPVALQRREFALLHELLANAGRVLSREQLEQVLYGWQEEVESNALEVHVHNLRKKLFPGLIKTVRGIGYTIDKQL